MHLGACLSRLETMPAKSDFRPRQIRAYYRALYSAWGPQHWWPGQTQFEVIAGSYLIQNTSWRNAELALRRLRSRNLLRIEAIQDIPGKELEDLTRPAGYFRQKAARLKLFADFVNRVYGGSLKRMFSQPTEKLRRELLELNGVGPETADSILLYAGQHPVFVVDAYARRILQRHKIVSPNTPYDEIRNLFERAFASESGLVSEAHVLKASNDTSHRPSPMSRARRSPAAQVLNEAHALMVGIGKKYCFKSDPDCQHCPLKRFLPKQHLNFKPAKSARIMKKS